MVKVTTGEELIVSVTGLTAAHRRSENATILAVKCSCTADLSIHHKGQSL